MPDDAPPLLRGPGQEAGDVDEGHQRDVEGVARADEARRLDRGVDVEHARERGGLVADDPDSVPTEPREAAHDVLRVRRLDLEERAVVDDRLDHAASCRRASAVESGISESSSGDSRSTGSVGGA